MAGLLALPQSATAEPPPVSTFEYTQNMHPTGYSSRVVPTENASPVDGIFNSDLAFWGRTAYQGTYEGFRIIDITEPDNPMEVNNFADCVAASTTGNQGDLLIWDDILVRSWNSNTGPAGAGAVPAP
jgi:hypothetical protein